MSRINISETSLAVKVLATTIKYENLVVSTPKALGNPPMKNPSEMSDQI